MKNGGRNIENGKKEERLADQIGRRAMLILLAVFAILIGITVWVTSASLTDAVDESVASNARNTAQQVQGIIEKAEAAAEDMEAYMQKAYELEGEGYSNMAGERIAQEDAREYLSTVYGKQISELNADVEKYITETARTTVINNDAIDGIGAMFEPYKFDKNLESYAFYIEEGSGRDDKIEPFGEYAEYSMEDYYKEAYDTKKPVFTDPYEYDGKVLISYAVPIMYNGELQGAIMADIDTENFKEAITVNEKYPSMYTTIYNEDYLDVFDSVAPEDVGHPMDDFFKNPKELQQAKEQMALGKGFSMESTREDGRTIVRYYFPFRAGDDIWWSMTALDKVEKNRDIMITLAVMLAVSIVSLVVIVSALTRMIRRKIRPIEGLVDAAEHIAEGNLQITVAQDSNAEIGRLAAAFQKTIERLQEIIGDVNYMLGEVAEGNFGVRTRAEESYVGDFKNIVLSIRKLNITMSNTLHQIVDASDQVALGSDQMAQSAQNLAEGATDQAGAVEELTATIEDVAVTTENNARKANSAYEQSQAYEQEAESGSERMRQLTDAMEGITATSREIEKIIEEIEDIASQTNLLSLNASIEAARAGEAGRGFAVVADQIGKLASDSAASAVNTRELIGKAIQEVGHGNEITIDTSKALEKVIEGIRMLAGSAKETSAMSASQAEAMKQIRQGVEQISSVVQSNSASAQETSATSEELSAQAENLKGLVGKFQLRK